MSCSLTSNTGGNTTKSKSLTIKTERLLLHTAAKSHQGSKISFRDFRLIGPYLVEKVLPNNNNIFRTLNRNKTQILHRIRLRKYNPEKHPDENCQEAQWQIDDNIVSPLNGIYSIAWKAEYGGHLFDIPIKNTDPNDFDIDESYPHGPDTPIVPRSFFHDSNDGQNRNTCFTSNPPVLQISKSKSVGQTQDIETTADLAHNDIPSKHRSQAQTLKLHVNLCHNHHRKRVTTLQHLRSTILLPKLFRETNLVILEAANTAHALILILIFQKYTDIDVCKILFQPLSCAISNLSLFSQFFAHTSFEFFLFFLSGAYTYHQYHP